MTNQRLNRVMGFAMAVALAIVGGTAWAGNLVSLKHGSEISEYATIPAALYAASDGDTLTLLGNVDQSAGFLSVDKSVTFDLGGYEIANRSENNYNMIFIGNGARVVFKNGTLHSRWQSVLVPNSNNSSVALTNCVISGNCVTYSGFSGVSVTIGAGSVVTCGTLLYGVSGHTVIVEDGEIYSSTLLTVSGTLLVRGGRFTKDPSAYLDAKRMAVAEAKTTSYGTTNYRVDVVENAATLIKAGTGEETEYVTVPLAINAASAGDTVRLEKDWVNPGAPYAITRGIVLDLNNHAISNTASANLLSVNAPSVVIKNGTLATPGQSSVVFGGANKAFLTNCVIGGATMTYSASRAELHVGKGCRLICNALVSSYVSGANSCRVTASIEDDDVICTSPYLFDGNNGMSYSHICVYGGKFAANPTACVAGNHKAVQETTATDYGNCNYTIVDRTGEETVVAEAVFPNGEAVKADTLANAVEYARMGDKVRFLADQTVSGSVSLNKCLTYDLNGHTYEMTTSGNFLYGYVDGIVFENGTIANKDNSLLLPYKENATMYVTNCVLKGVCGVYSSVAGSKVVLSGCTAELGSLFSRHSTCKVAVEVDGGCYTLSNNWGDNTAADSTLSIVSCRSNKDPSGYLAEGSFAAPIAYSEGGKSYSYASFKAEDAGLYDLTAFVAIGGQMYCETVANAYDYTPNCGELRLLKDGEINNSLTIRKTITINLNGHTLSQVGDSVNFLLLTGDNCATITGGGAGGTLAKLTNVNSALWVSGDGGEFTVEDCTVTGATFAYGSSGRVVVSSNAVIACRALVSSHETCKLTVDVIAGEVATTSLWDGATPAAGKGGYIAANGGVWNINPIAQTGIAAFTVGEGMWSRYSPAAANWTLETIPDTLEFDLSADNIEACTYTGTIPSGGKTITVNLSDDSGEWNQQRKLLGDFSALTNVGGLQFALGTVWSGAPSAIELVNRSGRLYVHINRGMIMILK